MVLGYLGGGVMVVMVGVVVMGTGTGNQVQEPGPLTRAKRSLLKKDKLSKKRSLLTKKVKGLPMVLRHCTALHCTVLYRSCSLETLPLRWSFLVNK